jgi:chitin-binding protein
MDTALRRFLAWTLLACLPLFASGCGGGGGGGGVPMTTISGIAMKGPIKGALVQVYQVLSDGRTGDLLGSGISGTDGKYAIQIPTSRASGPLLVVVKGQNGATYASESQKKDVNFTSTESFRAVVDAYDASQGITVSPLTEAAYQKLQQILTLNPALATDGRFADAVNAANRRIAMLFGIGNILADPVGDITHQAVLLIIDQMIVDLGVSANTTTVMSLMNQAFTDVTKLAYQTYLQALTMAANKVEIANPSLSSTIQAILTLAKNPPTEPDWTDTTPPTAPSNLSASTIALTSTTSSVVLSWSPSSDNKAVTGYEIYRDGGKIATVSVTGYTDPSLATNATYAYFVIAFDGAGNRSIASSQLSVPVGVPVIDITPPTAPSNLSASTFALSPATSSVVLMWSPSTDNKAVTGYEIYRDGSKIATVTMPGYTDPLLTNSTTYTYFIVAFDGAGNRSVASTQLLVTPNQPSLGVTVNGQLSSDITGLPQLDIIAPTAPSNLTASTSATSAITSSVLLAWNPSSDNKAVAGYEVYRNGIKIATVTLRGHTDPAVTSNMTYN